jgi:hypothetical protein
VVPTENFFSSGPFASASIDSENFAGGLYFTHLFQSSLDRHTQVEEARMAAAANNNLELALEKQTELDYLDGIFRLTIEIHKSDGGADS